MGGCCDDFVPGGGNGGGGGGGIDGIGVDDEGVPVGPGPFTELNFVGAGVTASDGGGGVAIINVPGAGADTAASNVLTFRPGSADTGPVVFNLWDDLYAELVSLRDNATVDSSGRFSIVFDSSLALCVIPSGGVTYNMVSTSWFGALTGPSRADVQVGDGVGADSFITNLLSITSLAITSAQTTPPIQTVSTAELTLDDTLIDTGSDGSTTVIDANFTTIRLGDESALLGRAGTPAVALSGSNQLEILIDGAYAQVGENSLGSAGGSDIVQIFMQSASGLVSLTQPDLVNPLSWSDDTSATVTKIVNRSGPFLPSLNGGATPIDLTTYGAPGGTIGYTVEATGLTPTVLLPSVALFEKGELIAIKRVDVVVDASSTITLTPNGTDKINNAASYTFSGQFAWVILQARGSDALGGWSGWNVLSQGPVVGTTGTFAPGSVIFAGAGGALAQDNTNFFWDDTNNRLGIGNNTPTTPLDVTGVARATNMTITAMTLGSILFAGAAGAVTQDNANFFWDDTNNRLGIGTTTPDSPLHVVGAVHITGKLTVDGAIDPTSLTLLAAGNLAYLENANGVSAAVSPANRGRLIYNTTAQKWQVSENGVAYASLVSGASMAIGGTVTSATTGSVLFAKAGPVLGQDNANFFWDTTNKRLGINTVTPALPLHIIGTATASSECLKLQSGSTSGLADMVFFNSVNTQKGGVGFCDSAQGGSFAAHNFMYSPGGVDWIMSDATTNWMRWYCTTNSVGEEFANGSASGVSTASHGRLRYNTTTDRFQISRNTSAYAELTTITSASATTGPIWFGNNGLNQLNFNATFFWDNSLNRLGVNTATPGTSLDVTGNAGSDAGSITMTNTNVGGFSDLLWNKSDNTLQGAVGYGNASVTITHLRAKNFLYSTGPDFLFANTTRAEVSIGMTDGSTFMEMANGSSAAVSAANTGRLRYNTTGQKSQLSFNAGSYFDVGTYAAALTTGSVLFANGSNQILQDNANLFWDDTNNRLGIKTATPGYALEVRDNINQATIWTSNAASNGFSGINFGDEAGPSISRMSIGHGGSTLGTTFLRNLNFIFTGVADDLVIANSTGVKMQFGMTDANTFLSLADGVSKGTGVTGTCLIKYDDTSKTLKLSLDGAAFVTVVTI